VLVEPPEMEVIPLSAITSSAGSLAASHMLLSLLARMCVLDRVHMWEASLSLHSTMCSTHLPFYHRRPMMRA